MRKSGLLLVLVALAAGALAFRLPVLGNRPFHGDEAVHAFKFRDLWEQGVYQYDPNEFHGPTIYYAALPSVWLHGRHSFADTREADYRLPVVVFGAAMVLLPALFAGGMDRRALVWAALLTAISPAFVFYSRYYIQEVLLAFFALGMLGCGWRYARTRRTGMLVGAGICAGLMIASKETAVFSFVALGIAFGLTAFWTRRVDNRSLDLRSFAPRKQVVPALAACLISACLFLAGVTVKKFGPVPLPWLSNIRGPFDYLRAYTPWFNRAHGTDMHRHPWFYYLKILIWTHARGGAVWSEGIIVGLAVVATVFALMPRAKARLESGVTLTRVLAFYTWTLTAIYSIIPYKTPWCVLGFLSGMILLAGIGASILMRCASGRVAQGIVGLAIFAACVQLGQQSYRTSFVAYTDPANPYVYAQPVPEAVALGQRVEELSHAWPQGDAMVIKVFSIDTYYWPLPWYLRRFPNVGYWTEVPQDADAPLVLASPQFDDAVSQKLGNTHLMNGFRSIRSGVFFEIWPRMDLWADYLKTRKKEPGE